MLKKLFSITEYNDTHNLLKLFGIKIKYPNREFRKIRKGLIYEKYKKTGVDITSIPVAEGQIRDIQLANLALLKELDYVCKQCKLTYWIDFGTLLGAYRHKGFIPWDDDIDVGMLRDKYDKIIDCFNKTTRNSDLFADYEFCKNKSCQRIIKIQHKKCSHLFVDIFPYDNFGIALTENEQIEESKKIKAKRLEMQNDTAIDADKDEIEIKIEKYRSALLKNTRNENYDYVWGIDYSHHWKNWFTNKDVLFPLKEIKFENFSFPCINNIEEYLKKVYGNYMNYPNKFGFGHSMFARLTKEDKEIINKLRS